MALSDTTIRNAKPSERAFTLTDERGLSIQIQPNGGKWWRFRYRFEGKEKMLSLGTYPDVGLKEARERRDDARKLVADGVDPSEQRKARKAAKISETEHSFEAVARRWHRKVSNDLVLKYAEKIIRSLEVDVFPAIGSRPIAEIRPPEVLAMLRKIEARGALETLKRVRQRCADVFTFAIAEGIRESENPVTGLEKTLKTIRPEHHASLHVRQLPEFFIRLDAVRISHPVKLAVQLAILLFLRPGELRCAHWEEIDLDTGTWVVPGERDRTRGMVGMKMKDAHVVPLSRQAVGIFEQLQAYSGHGELVFPNRNDPSRPMSDGTVNSALRAMGYSGNEVTGHGFRATAASALAEMGFRKEVIDRQLAHKERNQVLAAYIHQAEYIDERRMMMQAWADHIDKLKASAKIIVMPSAV